MAGIIQSPANLPITLVKGADFALGLTITESAVPYPWAGATVTTSIVNSRTGEVNATNWTFTPGADGAATMTLTDTNTTALGVGTFDYYVQVTKSGTTTPWLAGQLSTRAPWETAVSAMTVNLSFSTGGSVTLTVTNSAPTASAVQITDAGGYFAATNVETMGQELGARTNGLQRLPTTVIAQSIPRTHVRDNLTSSLVSGQQSFVLVWLPAGLISTISFASATTAAGTPTAQWFSLYSSARAKLAVTADDTSAAWAANTVKTLTISGGYTVLTEGYHYLGCMVAAGTVPTLLGYVSSTVTNILPPIVSGRDTTNTGLTTPGTAPATAAAFSTLAGDPFAYVT